MRPRPCIPTILLIPLAASACVVDETSELATERSEIRNSTTLASAYYRERAAAILSASGDPSCTATRISANWLLTAMHCDVQVGEQIAFYSTTSAYYDNGRRVTVAQVERQPGTSPSGCDTVDSPVTSASDACEATDGDFADIALVRISDATFSRDGEGPPATMAWKFPSQNPVGTKVGAGNHGGAANPEGRLLQVSDNIVDSSDGDGSFDTGDDDIDGSDSGGPFYVSNKVVGVLWGWVDFGLDDYNVYTSVPEHLDWILSTIGFRWQGLPVLSGTRYVGTTVDSFLVDSERVCQYACEQSTSCEAYNYDPDPGFGGFTSNECELKTGVTGLTSSSAWRGALRHGARAGVSNDVVGYRRTDGYDVAVHRSTDDRVHEIFRSAAGDTGWAVLGSNAPRVGSDLSAYVRSDGVNAVVYRSTSNRIIELALGGQWRAYDLSDAGGSPPVGDPVAYVRADGVDAVVYRDASGYIHELSRGIGGWTARNLTISAATSVRADSDPAVLARADGFSSVVFRSGTRIYELYRRYSGNWVIGSPSDKASAPAAGGRPYAYRHADGITAIVYRTASNRLQELWLVGETWYTAQLSNSAITGDPSAYVRTDTIESVIVRSSSARILEIANAPWTTYDLMTATSESITSSTDPSAFVMGGGFNAVLFETSDNRVRRISYKVGEPWVMFDLSNQAGETP